MKTHGSTLPALLLCATIGAALLTTACETSVPITPVVSTQSLLGTSWRLTQLGDDVIDNAPGDRAIHFALEQSNTNLVGFSGCNRMFGRYALDGASLKFDGLGGTRMFCQANMELEQRFLAMFQNVTGWRITGPALQLLDADARPVATFNTP